MAKDPFEMRKIIFNCHPDNMVTAVRAAKYFLERPDQKDAIISYGDGKVSFYVKRNKGSISIIENH